MAFFRIVTNKIYEQRNKIPRTKSKSYEVRKNYVASSTATSAGSISSFVSSSTKQADLRASKKEVIAFSLKLA